MSRILTASPQLQGRQYSTIFKMLMKLNNAKVTIVEPSLYIGGYEGYVNSMLREIGIGNVFQNCNK